MTNILFVTVDEAKIHLRVVGNESDLDILLKIELASSVVMDYLKVGFPSPVPEVVTAADIWENEVHQAVVRAATLLVLTDLYDDRGTGDLTTAATTFEYLLTPTVKSVLHRLRDPALA